MELTASHDLEARGIVVEILDPVHEARKWFPDIVAGFREYEAERSSEGRPIGAVRLTVTKVDSHPVDTNSRLMRRLAKETIRTLFEQHGQEITAQ